MNKNTNCLFQAAEIEVVNVNMCDIIVTSPMGPDPFEGEEEMFPTNWRDYNGE